MYRLRALGGLSLERNKAPVDDVATQRKSLALLAALAVHGTMSRDRLMALLWPESEAARARGSLKQAIHQLRRMLAEPELLLGTTELRLNPDRVESDVQLFRDALRRGDTDAAIAFYQGPFLDGVHVDGSTEFERWVDGCRDDLASQFRGALEAQAVAAEARGDRVAAVAWWRRLQGADPLSSRVALLLMKALEEAGDPASAVRHARLHDTLLREELGIAPDAAVAELAARLAATSAAAPPASTAEIRPAGQPRSPVLPAGSSPVLAAEAAGVAHSRPAPTRAPRRRVRQMVLGTTLLAAIGAAGTLRFIGPATSGASAESQERGVVASVAVLPLVDMSAENDLAYLADGIAEEILNMLADIPGLRVPARTSSFHFRGRNEPVREIAAALGVDHLLEGSLRRDGNIIRVTAQLIDATEDRHIWSQTFDSEFGNVFAMQEEIARAVAGVLRVRLASGGVGAPPRAEVAPAAHDLYLRGLFHWNRRSAPDLLLALRFFDEATQIDPAFARAWAGLALVYAVIPIGFTPPIPMAESRSRMEHAAERALALEPTLAEVHAARGLAYHFAWRWQDAEREFLRAIELNPHDATAHQWYAEHLAKVGRGDAAQRAIRRALELDPLSLVIRNDLGLVLVLDRQPGAARAAWEAVLRMDPNFSIPHYFLHRLALGEGRLEEAEAWGRRWAELTNVAPAHEIVTLTRAVGTPALRPQAMAILDAWSRGGNPRWHDIAFYLTQLGETDAAVDVLEAGLEAGAPMMAQIGHSPWLDPLRESPRFQRLVQALAFPD